MDSERTHVPWHSASCFLSVDLHFGQCRPPLLPLQAWQNSRSHLSQQKIHIQLLEKPFGLCPHAGQRVYFAIIRSLLHEGTPDREAPCWTYAGRVPPAGHGWAPLSFADLFRKRSDRAVRTTGRAHGRAYA